ncbi:Transport permease protein [Lactococcus hircilactis]|nr:ATP-binding cassette domain-containing protein [Lactococcus hircilactis]
MLKIQAEHLYKKFSVGKRKLSLRQDAQDFFALSDISFMLSDGECLGIIGKNGAGKSTLTKILSDQLTASAGKLRISGDVSILAINAGLQQNLTGRENIQLKGLMLGMTRREIIEKMPEIIDFSELLDVIDAPVKTYSTGMKARLGFSIMVHQTPDILIIDEALSVGDASFMEKSLRKIQEFRVTGKTIVLVSHSMATIKKWCDKVIWLDEGRIKSFGPANKVCERYESFVKESKISVSADRKINLTKNRSVSTDNDLMTREIRRQLQKFHGTPSGWIFPLAHFFFDQFKYFRIALNLSTYRTKSANFQHKLGRLWELLDPLFQLAIYYVIFGLLFKRVVPDFPALPWMFIGLGVYSFMQNTMVTGALSIRQQFHMVSKMKFPLSILPLSALIGFLTNLVIALVVSLGLALASAYNPTAHLLQFFYYFPALVLFTLAVSLINSSILVVFPDMRFFLNYGFRFLMYGSGAIFSLDQFHIIPAWLRQLQLYNPFYYLIAGFRDCVFGTTWFWEKASAGLSFWLVTLLLLVLATHVHYGLRERMGDYL